MTDKWSVKEERYCSSGDIKIKGEWISVKDEEAPFAVEVEVKTTTGEIRKDMIIPTGGYATWWAGCNYSKLDEPTHWRGI